MCDQRPLLRYGGIRLVAHLWRTGGQWRSLCHGRSPGNIDRCLSLDQEWSTATRRDRFGSILNEWSQIIDLSLRLSARPFRTTAGPIHSDRSSVQPSSLGAQIVQLADRRRAFGHNLAAPNSLVYTEISPIVSPSHSPARLRQKETVEHGTVAEDLQEKYQSLLHRFEQTVQMSSEALNLSRISQGLAILLLLPVRISDVHSVSLLDPSSTATSDLRVLLNDLKPAKPKKVQMPKGNETFDMDNTRETGDIEDDLALILNDKQERPAPKPTKSNIEQQPSK